MEYVWLISLLLLMLASFRSIKGEHFITNNVSPSYLYHYIDDVKEDIFPQNITIKMSLSSISGIVFYSIDRNMNQLIVTLHDSMEVTLGIEYNTQKFLISMNQLCGCKRCRYQILELAIKMNETINIRCNMGNYKIVNYIKIYGLNMNYPNPYSHISGSQPKNDAHLWLVNHQKYGKILPNHNQISGCIFDVSYKGVPIIFSTVIGNIEPKCTKVCIGDECHGGQCYETFSEAPLCDCTRTFKNGVYCNDITSSKNLKSTDQNFMLEKLKLSWKSTSNEIFSLENEDVRIRLLRSDVILAFEYKNMKYDGYITDILTEHYLPNNQYILIATFHNNTIDLRLIHNNTSRDTFIPTDKDLSKQIFKSLSLRSGNGVIDFAWKVSNRYYSWRNEVIRHFTLLDIEQPSLDNTRCPNLPKCDSEDGYIAAICIILVVCVIIVLLAIFFGLKHFKVKRRKPRNTNDENTEENTDTPSDSSQYVPLMPSDDEVRRRIFEKGYEEHKEHVELLRQKIKGHSGQSTF